VDLPPGGKRQPSVLNSGAFCAGMYTQVILLYARVFFIKFLRAPSSGSALEGLDSADGCPPRRRRIQPRGPSLECEIIRDIGSRRGTPTGYQTCTEKGLFEQVVVEMEGMPVTQVRVKRTNVEVRIPLLIEQQGLFQCRKRHTGKRPSRGSDPKAVITSPHVQGPQAPHR
jgi:hypothetical protein